MSAEDPRIDALIDAILPHVAFDGWSPAAFKAAVAQVGLSEAEAMALCPRGAVSLAIAYHERGDRQMVAALTEADLSDMRFRDKVAHALWLRIQAIDDKEAVRRASAMFALPHLAGDGTRLIWGTADAIWEALGDPSEDINWYTKRATLSGVWGSVVLYWLGDDSLEAQATRAFIDRRIDNVMQIEKVKAQVNDNALLRPLMRPLGALLSGVRAPRRGAEMDLPGEWNPPSPRH